MAYSPDLTTAVLRCFIAAITSDLRRRARKRKIRGHLETGAMTVVQRFGSAIGLNVHFHTLAVDGVWARKADRSLLFHPLPAPNDEDVASIARAVCRKVGRLLARQKTTDDGQTSLLDELANASVQGLVATGPRRGCRVLRLGTTGQDRAATITGKRCADVAGFNVHANTSARAGDRERLGACGEFWRASVFRAKPPDCELPAPPPQTELGDETRRSDDFYADPPSPEE